MKLGDYLAKDCVLPEIVSETRSDTLKELIAPLGAKYPEMDTDLAVRVLLEREKLGTTGIGDGIAIPHGKVDGLDAMHVIVGRSLKGVEYDALDQKPCTIFFLVLAPEEAVGIHLRVLAQISRLLKDETFRRSFLEAEGRDELWGLLKSV
ncbi:PTS transporter subunit EIIA [Pseudodesulfovibrio sp. JC047]|uniref:PTS sugar transporter subunit IIA n=1 Tax=Pseudodesulfovibrio sp. JC047 TaxID=2683199 RepID=UPI0013D0DF90|nr:PTS sugar transporter subunit IIA [Pseudodesulfovibrio sp. JC047]NDV19200.1 PTS transporter subunit EIIA [Pseudodesulfovibrio sp. JC047]